MCCDGSTYVCMILLLYVVCTHTFTFTHAPVYIQRRPRMYVCMLILFTYTNLQYPHLSEGVNRQAREVERRRVRGHVQTVHRPSLPPLLDHRAEVFRHQGPQDWSQEQLFCPFFFFFLKKTNQKTPNIFLVLLVWVLLCCTGLFVLLSVVDITFEKKGIER